MSDIINAILIQPLTNLFALMYFVTGQNIVFTIILLSIVVKLLLFPLYKKQMLSVYRLRKIQPQIDKITKKFKDNPQKMQLELSKLYKKAGYNPLGCFTSFAIQLPILWSLYSVIKSASFSSNMSIYGFLSPLFEGQNNVTINFTEWGIDFVTKLRDGLNSNSGWFFILLIATLIIVQMSVTIYNMQNMPTTSNTNNTKKKLSDEEIAAQKAQKIAYWVNALLMSGFFVMVALSLPTILTIYWISQSIIQFLQQLIVKRLHARDKL